MTKIEITERGKQSFALLTSKRLQNRLAELLKRMQEAPTFGSGLVRDSLKDEFGEICMKAVLSPYLLIYEYDEPDDIVHVYGIVHGRRVK